MRVGLIAMSGVRVQDSELMALGLTLPGFVERSRVIASLPSLSLLTLAGMTPPDVEVDYIEVDDIDQAVGLPGDFDLVAISTYSAQALEAYALADRLRAAGKTVVIGGLHATALPEEALTHADSVAVGEGELTWPRIIRDFQRGALQSVYRPDRGDWFDLAESPMPRFDLLDPERYNRLTVQTTRGCPHRCHFCAASPLLTPHWQAKPVDRIMAEIGRIREIWEHPFIEFADDNTFAQPGHGRALMRALLGEGIKWFTETDLSVAEDPTLLSMMRDSGCRQILIGLESPTASGLEGIELRRNWKRERLGECEDAIQRIQGHGITVNGCFVLGLDGDTDEVFETICDFVERTGLFEVQLTVLTAFPGTPLIHQLEREGRILEPWAWNRCTLFDVNHVPRGMSPERLRLGLREMMTRIYDPESVRGRRERFFRTLRRNRLPGVENQEKEWAHAGAMD